MNELICPFCQQAIACTDAQDAGEYSTWFCPRCVAERNWCAFGNKTLWQELIRTQKALDVAVNALKKLSLGNVPSLPDDETLALAMCNYARDTIEQITALEQKD